MHTDVKIAAQDFTEIHNTLWDMEQLSRRLTGNEADELAALVVRVRGALADAYRQDDAEFERLHTMYDEIAQASGYTHSIWSMYEVKNFSEVPWPDAARLVYRMHWGDPVEIELAAADWHALWAAADVAIHRSGDRHHIYIEDIRPTDEPGVLELCTGS